jgi:cell division protein FtsW (lipid II flippase)
MSLSRADRSGFSAWWWTTDRVAFSAMIALIAIGLMLAFAASPAATGSAVAAGDFRYAAKQIAFAGVTAGLGVLSYFFVSHVHHRVDQYFSHDKTGGGYQTGLALKAFAHGGLTGVGPGAGTVKYHLPDAHSDFIFAVAGEEFGLVLCGLIAALFCALAVRLLLRSAYGRDAFTSLCGASLATVVALQAFINMGSATSLLPAKGMTLPFISYGGSSLFAVALTMGYALAVTRQRPRIGERDHEMFRFLKEAT